MKEDIGNMEPAGIKPVYFVIQQEGNPGEGHPVICFKDCGGECPNYIFVGKACLKVGKVRHKELVVKV